MKNLILIVAALTLAACASSSNQDASKEVTVTVPAAQQKAISTPAAAKPFTPTKPIKCKYDTDCAVADSCVANKCKLGGNECRFRSDCPSPRGTCVANKCEFH